MWNTEKELITFDHLNLIADRLKEEPRYSSSMMFGYSRKGGSYRVWMTNGGMHYYYDVVIDGNKISSFEFWGATS